MVSLLVLFGISSVYAQNFSKDIAALNHAYYDLNKSITISSTITAETGEKRMAKTKVVMKNIDDYYMENDQSEILIQEGIKIAVSHVQKVIIIDSNYTDKKSDLPMLFYDSLVKFYSTIEHTKLSNGLEKYHLIPKIGSSEYIEIYFNRNSMLFQKVIVKSYDQNNKGYFTISNQYSYAPILTGDIPTITSYYNIDSHHLSSKWRNYELVNYLKN